MSKPKPKKDQSPKTSRYLPRWIIFVIIFALLILGFFVHKAYQRRRLNDKLQSYRDAGLPADAADLENWLPTPPDDQNATLQILNAASLFTDWTKKPIPNDPNLAQMYPLLILKGLILSDNPPPDWNQKNLNLLPVIGNSQDPEPGQSLGPYHTQAIADFLADNAAGMQQLHLALQLNQFRCPLDYGPQGIETPNLGYVLNAAKKLQLQTLLRLENARPDLAAQSVTDSFRLARSLYTAPLLIAYNIGEAVCTPIAVKNLEHTLSRYPLNHNQLDDITAALTDLQSAPGLSIALIGERAIYCDLLYNSLPVVRLFNAFGLVDMEYLLYLDFMDRYIAVLNLPFDQRLKAVQDIENQKLNLSRVHFLFKMIMPPISRFFERDLRNQAQLQNARTALAIEHYRLDHNNQLPITLNDLVPDYLPSVPLDPYNGHPVKYQKTDTGYLTYSVGPDLTDNLGNPIDATGDRFTTGTDITLTIKRK